MNTQSQKGFIPLIALIIALLSIGGGVTAYEIHKHNEETKIETQTSDDANTNAQQKGETSTTQDNITPREHTATQPVVAVQTSTKATTALTAQRQYEREEDEEEEDDDEGGRSITAPAPATNPAAATTFYTMAQVKTHNSRTSCWTAVYGGVYDVTAWISQHPGGAGAIVSMCGVDGTSSFDAQHGGQSRANAELGSFKIGVLK